MPLLDKSAEVGLTVFDAVKAARAAAARNLAARAAVASDTAASRAAFKAGAKNVAASAPASAPMAAKAAAPISSSNNPFGWENNLLTDALGGLGYRAGSATAKKMGYGLPSQIGLGVAGAGLQGRMMYGALNSDAAGSLGNWMTNPDSQSNIVHKDELKEKKKLRDSIFGGLERMTLDNHKVLYDNQDEDVRKAMSAIPDAEYERLLKTTRDGNASAMYHAITTNMHKAGIEVKSMPTKPIYLEGNATSKSGKKFGLALMAGEGGMKVHKFRIADDGDTERYDLHEGDISSYQGK